MKAILYDKSAAPDVFSLCEVEKPVPIEGQVLVRIHAASINAADYRSISMGMIPKNRIFGSDVAGTVEAAGSAVRDFKVGDEVFGDIIHAGWGGLAEYVAVPESCLAAKPASISFSDAASLPVAGLTALQGLRKWTDLKPGQKVLIYGAGGGVGTFAVQLAKISGAQVTAVCGPRNVELIQSLGADRVLDYSKEDFAKENLHYDLIYAINGNRPLSAYLRALLPKGVLAVAGGALTQIFSTMLLGPVLSLGGRQVKLLSAKPNRADLETLAGLVAQGRIKPVIDHVYPLEETPQAFEYITQGHARGKVIISVVQD